jgi:urease accessory protein UreF
MMRTKKSACPASPEPDRARSEAESLLGEFRDLFRQIGSPGVGAALDGPFWAAPLQAPATLGQFLEDYLARLLLPLELPAIVAACGHARRGELRELLAQDHGLASPLLPTPFAVPSKRMGGLQLARLRPLRDSRIVQRYLAAVECGQAHGWHTVVYGVTLAVFSLPLRQGLLYYARETLSVLASAAGRSKSFGPSELDEVLTGLLARLPEGVEAALASEGGCALAAHYPGQLLPEV